MIEDKKWLNLDRDEEVIWASHPSLILEMPQLLMGIFLAVVGLVTAIYLYFFTGQDGIVIYTALALIPVGIGISLYRWVYYSRSYYVITNQQIVKKIGILGRSSVSKGIENVERVDVRITPFEGLLNKISNILDRSARFDVNEFELGDLVVRVSDDSGDEFLMNNVPHAGDAEAHINRLRRDAKRDLYGGRERDNDTREIHEEDVEPLQETETKTDKDTTTQSADNDLDEMDPDEYDEYFQEPSDKA